MFVISPLPGTVAVAATNSSVNAAITMPETANGLYVVNTGSVRATIALGYGAAPTASLGTSGPTLPPGTALLVETNNRLTHVAAIAASAGPHTVVFTPVRLP